MKHEPKDLPSIKKLEEEYNTMKPLTGVFKFFSFFGIGGKKLKNIKSEFVNIEKQIEDYKNYPTKYNQYFSEEGFVVHDNLDFEVIKNAVDIYESKGIESAKEIIVDFYSPEKMSNKTVYFEYADEFKERFKFIEFASKDYIEGRYYSCIPL